MDLREGLYELLVTGDLEELLSRQQLNAVLAEVDSELTATVLARHVGDVVRSVLAAAQPKNRVTLTNGIIDSLNRLESSVRPPTRQLMALVSRHNPNSRRLHSRPQTPLSEAALLTNARDEPALSTELRSEIATADRVDLLCAFIRWHGLRLLEEQLSDAHNRGTPLRVITTTYVGSTERRALDELVRRYGADVRISYETNSTRLHAKAWLFYRDTGYDTAYVGSSNLSRSALVEGLEWNVRLSAIATPVLVSKFAATFDTYWHDAAFEPYDPDRDADRLDDALAIAGGRGGPMLSLTLSGLEVRPYPHQSEILEALDVERRVHDRHQNLVVAATGTGKTIVAALDYKSLREEHGDLSLLVVAHRKEILQQSLRTYREVLAEGAFGELYVDGSRPERWRHVFASVQSLSSYGVKQLDPAHFDVVVIDEFHHAEARTYRQLLDHLQPRELLGLTATPERADGVDVRDFFDGHTAAELRLWDALAADLLCPFHYFGLSDDVDLSGVEWKKGSYDVVGLDRLYTGNDSRAAKILRELRDKVTDVSRMRALGFCVSVAHAEYMARVLREAGIAALAVSGRTGPRERADALQALRDGTVPARGAAARFNEGLDLPSIDTVLFLRPTQSATIFMQQLGRGLRRAPGKAVLTVLDFIGQHRREFRFDIRYRALTGSSRRQLVQQVEHGFPYLPAGSQLILDRVARETVLENLKRQLRLDRKALVQDIRSHGHTSLLEYLVESELEAADVYRADSWTTLLRAAGLPTRSGGPREDGLLRRMKTLLHVDNVERANAYASVLRIDGPGYAEMSDREQRFARMLFFALWPDGGGFSSLEEGLSSLVDEGSICDELSEILTLGVEHAAHVPRDLEPGLQHLPLATHARYSREEILAGIDYASLLRRPTSHREGVAFSEAAQTDAFLVTLNKVESEYSPTTMYQDYAISPTLFHWESQSTTTVSSATGQRYLTHRENGSHVLLFAREHKQTEIGTAVPYLCLGPATYVEHRGERPIAITWQLRHPLPADVFRSASVVAS